MNQGMEHNELVDDLLELKAAPSIAAQSRALTEIIRKKNLHEASRHPLFSEIVTHLGVVAGDPENTERILAISMLCKIAGLVRQLRKDLEEVLRTSLIAELGSLQLLGDPDDRYYAATFWRFGFASWSLRFLAKELVFEESAESVRRELAEGLVTSSRDYKAVISMLGDALTELRFSTDQPANSMAKRLKRVMTAIRHSVSEVTSLDVGPSFGVPLRELVRRTFSRTGPPADRKATQEVAIEIIEFLIVVIRTRLAAAFEPDTYAVLFSLRDWFSPNEWDLLLETRTGRFIRRDVADTLEVTVRSGRIDKELRAALLLACSSRDTFDAEINRIVNSNLGLSAELVSWLRGEELVKQTDSSQESQMARMEKDIAALLRETLLLSALRVEVEDDLLPSLETFASIPIGPLRRLVGAASEIGGLAQDLARERSLELFGRQGEEVEFSVLEHSMVEGVQLGSRVVRVLQPGVLARSDEGRRRVVVKAVVTAVN
jgi:hypothetical protein